MSEHLPECDVRIGPVDGCRICSLLRACEQRVKDDWYEIQSATWALEG